MQKSKPSITSAPGEVHWSHRPYLNIRTAAELLGVSRGMVYRLNKAGDLRFVNIGQRRLVNVDSLTRYIDGLEARAAEREAQAVQR